MTKRNNIEKCEIRLVSLKTDQAKFQQIIKFTKMHFWHYIVHIWQVKR